MEAAFPLSTIAAEELLSFLYILWSRMRANVALSNSSHLAWHRGYPMGTDAWVLRSTLHHVALPGMGRQWHGKPQQLRARQDFCCSVETAVFLSEKEKTKSKLKSNDRRA